MRVTSETGAGNHRRVRIGFGELAMPPVPRSVRLVISDRRRCSDERLGTFVELDQTAAIAVDRRAVDTKSLGQHFGLAPGHRRVLQRPKGLSGSLEAAPSLVIDALELAGRSASNWKSIRSGFCDHDRRPNEVIWSRLIRSNCKPDAEIEFKTTTSLELCDLALKSPRSL